MLQLSKVSQEATVSVVDAVSAVLEMMVSVVDIVSAEDMLVELDSTAEAVAISVVRDDCGMRSPYQKRHDCNGIEELAGHHLGNLVENNR